MELIIATRVFYGCATQSPIIGYEVRMENPDIDSVRHRHNHDDDVSDMRRSLGYTGPRPVAVPEPRMVPHINDDELLTDIKYVLDQMEGEYVGPEFARVLRRLRTTVGPSA